MMGREGGKARSGEHTLPRVFVTPPTPLPTGKEGLVRVMVKEGELTRVCDAADDIT